MAAFDNPPADTALAELTVCNAATGWAAVTHGCTGPRRQKAKALIA